MRDLNKCQAEVFRRSEKRTKERKQRRKHILMACIPLVLCITIFGAFIMPNLGFISSTDQQAPESSNEQFSGIMGTDGVAGLFAGTVEVSGNGISHTYSSVEDVQSIKGLINEIVASPETNEDNVLEDYITDESTSTGMDDNYKEKGYKILVKRSDGTSTEYLLVGSVLIDQSTQEEFHMDENTYFDLKEALGIPYY